MRASFRRACRLAIKHAADRVVAAVSLVLLAPLFFLIAAAIKLCDGGPVFFLQDRHGLGGELFRSF